MPDSEITAFRSESPGPCSECQLVLQAVGISSEISRDENGFAVFVSLDDFERARSEIQAFQEENRGHEPRPSIRHPDYFSFYGALVGYAIALIGFALLAEFNVGGLNWYAAGRIDSERVLNGELWRLATALTLHLDLAHITSNLGFGLALMYFAGRFFGSGLALLSVLSAGVLGNALNVAIKGVGHGSVGASTAIFAALGLIGLYSFRMRVFPQQRWAQRLGPVIGVIALLAYSGTGGERTDIGAHFWGFVAGAALGWYFAKTSDTLRRDPFSQKAYATTALLLLAAAWFAALW